MADYNADRLEICEYCEKEHLGTWSRPRKTPCKAKDLKRTIDRLRKRLDIIRRGLAAVHDNEDLQA